MDMPDLSGPPLMADGSPATELGFDSGDACA